jgi:DNA-nicking Smr family endonuclease
MARARNRQPRFDSRDDLLDGSGATLDLHRAGAAEAKAAVRAFIATEARTARGSVVHIITGKGRGSAHGAVLRPAIAAELRGPACAPLIADWARDANDGGFKARLR